MKHRTEIEGKKLVADFFESGLTSNEFVSKTGVTLCALQYWKKRVQVLAKNKSGQSRFVEVVASGQESGVVRVSFGNVHMDFSSLPSAVWLLDFVLSLNSRR